MHDDCTSRPPASPELIDADVRCPLCSTLQGQVAGFFGTLEIICRKCKHLFFFSGLDRGADPAPSDFHILACRGCRKTILRSTPYIGSVSRKCNHCKAIVLFDSTDTRPVTMRGAAGRARPFGLSDEEFLKRMEEHWATTIRTRSVRRAEAAVGIRFDVFKRDGFACRYCGRSASEGVMLHADHVIPQSKGGPTTMENLVTACQDCNLGKSDKDLQSRP